MCSLGGSIEGTLCLYHSAKFKIGTCHNIAMSPNADKVSVRTLITV
jgi:hypothetical protein